MADNTKTVMSQAELDQNLKRIEEKLAKMNINKQTRIQDLVSNVKDIDVNDANLKTTYDPTFMGEEINIFKLPLVDVTKKFFTKLLTDPEQSELFRTNFDGRIDAFILNVQSLANSVAENLKKPENQRTIYGLTPLSAYTREETRRITGGLRLPQNLLNTK